MHVKTVHAFFVVHPQHDQQTAGHSQRQPENIDERKDFVLNQYPPCRFKVIAEHNHYLIDSDCAPIRCRAFNRLLINTQRGGCPAITVRF